MSKLLKVALAAALGFAVSAPLYAGDAQNQSPAWSDSQVRAAMDKCNNLTGTPKSKCIVNIRPTSGGDRSAMNSGTNTDEDNVVKDGNARAEEEYAAAVKQCESANASDKDGCIITTKEKFGRM